tara:strand:- start:131 stop:1258 length:1128 start_codon:yes stop_codon:yes gene_type:complete
MSTIKVDTIRNYDSAVDFSQGFNVGGASIIQNYTESADMPETPTPVNGDYWWDTANEVLYRYMDGGFRAIGIGSSAHNNARAFMGGGSQPGTTNQIQYFGTASSGNASDFGDLTGATYRAGALTDGAGGRGLIFGGNWSPPDNVIQYITVANTGNATDFGDLTNGSRTILGGCSDGTYGVMLAGNKGSASSGTQADDRIMDRVTVQTAANSTDHGDLVSDTFSSWQSTSCAGSARGLHLSTTAPSGGSAYTQLEYFDITTASNAANFGTLSSGNYAGAGVSDATRSVFGGATSGNNLEYVTPATLGNGTAFGDLTVNRDYAGGADNLTYGFFCGGESTGGSKQNVIDYITIQTAANATDWGDLATAVEAPATSAA